MNVRHGNLFEAIKNYREAIFYLDTVNPKPEFYTELKEKCCKMRRNPQKAL